MEASRGTRAAKSLKSTPRQEHWLMALRVYRVGKIIRKPEGWMGLGFHHTGVE